MAVLFVHTDRLEIRLTRAEKVLSFRRTDIVVPLDSIRSAASSTPSPPQRWRLRAPPRPLQALQALQALQCRFPNRY